MCWLISLPWILICLTTLQALSYNGHKHADILYRFGETSITCLTRSMQTWQYRFQGIEINQFMQMFIYQIGIPPWWDSQLSSQSSQTGRSPQSTEISQSQAPPYFSVYSIPSGQNVRYPLPAASQFQYFLQLKGSGWVPAPSSAQWDSVWFPQSTGGVVGGGCVTQLLSQGPQIGLWRSEEKSFIFTGVILNLILLNKQELAKKILFSVLYFSLTSLRYLTSSRAITAFRIEHFN